jgi:hypothetical protein
MSYSNVNARFAWRRISTRQFSPEQEFFLENCYKSIERDQGVGTVTEACPEKPLTMPMASTAGTT